MVSTGDDCGRHRSWFVAIRDATGLQGLANAFYPSVLIQ